MKRDTAINSLDKLKKLNNLLSVIAQSIHDKSSSNEEIETCIGIAWDLGESVFSLINNDLESMEKK